MSPAPSREAPRALGRLRTGFVLAVLGAFWVSVGTFIAILPSGNASRSDGLMNVVMAAVLLLGPGLYLWLTARATRARALRLERLVALATLERRMPIGDAATTLGVDVATARGLLLDAVACGMLTGRIDAERNLFLSGSAPGDVTTRHVRCVSCGARTSALGRSDEAVRCGYCGAATVPTDPA